MDVQEVGKYIDTIHGEVLKYLYRKPICKVRLSDLSITLNAVYTNNLTSL